MKICESCDHNVKLECQGGCFHPHITPPCYRELEAKVTSPLKAEIRLFLNNSTTMSTIEFYKWIGDNSARLRELSAG